MEGAPWGRNLDYSSRPKTLRENWKLKEKEGKMELKKDVFELKEPWRGVLMEQNRKFNVGIEDFLEQRKRFRKIKWNYAKSGRLDLVELWTDREEEIIGDQEEVIKNIERRWGENYAKLIGMTKEEVRKMIEDEKRSKNLGKEKGSKAKIGNRKKDRKRKKIE